MHDMHDTFEHFSECKLLDEQQPFRQSKGLWKQICAIIRKLSSWNG